MTPLMRALRDNEPDALEEAFKALHPSAFDAARQRLGDTFQDECKDVASEAIRRLFDRIGELESEHELRPLVVVIARYAAIDQLRKIFAEKRGGNKVESLDALTDADSPRLAAFSDSDVLDQLP